MPGVRLLPCCFVLMGSLALAAAPRAFVIEDGRPDPAAYYDEKPTVLDQSASMAAEGKTSVHFKSGEGSGRMLLTKYHWPAEVDFSAIAAEGRVQFSLWIDDPTRIKSQEMGDRIEFCIGGRSNDKFAYWYIPAAMLLPRHWNQVTLALHDGAPDLAESTVNGAPLSGDKQAAVAGSGVDWGRTNYSRFAIPFAQPVEGYLDNVVAAASAPAATQPVSLVEQELDPMAGCPDFDTDRIIPPDVGQESFFKNPEIDFAKIKGWTAQFVGGTGQFYLSKRQAIRGVPNARLEMRAQRPGRIILTPPAPIPVDHPFDTVEAWVYGAYHEGVAMKVNFREPSGKTFSISGGDEEYAPGGLIFSNWMLYRKRNPTRQTAPAGTTITSIEIGPFPGGANYLFTLDQLQLTRFDLSKEPAPEFAHAGAEVKIPLTEQGSCPVTRSEIQTKVTEEQGKFILEVQSKDQSPAVRYILSPQTGTMGDLSVEIVGKGTFRPAADSGPVIVQGEKTLDPVHDPAVPRQLLSAKLEGEAAAVSWAYGPAGGQTIIDYRFHLMGKTLAVEASSRTPTVSRWFYGHADGLEKPKVIESPYRKNDANFLWDRGMFVSYLPDWYLSNSSTIPYLGLNKVEGDKAWFGWSEEAGQYGYLSRTDGRRWPFKERFYLAVSNHYDEILPTVNNPPSPLKETLKQYVWLMVSNRGDQLPLVKQYAQRCIDLGMTRTYFMWHAPFWSNRGGRGPEAFIGRLKVSERFDGQGGTEAMIEFYQMLRQHGFRTGYYEGYLFLEPVASYFHRDWLGFDSNGDWLPIWVQAYRPKPAAFAEYAATVSKERKDKFGADVVYQDGWTSQLAWESNDYDARYPEAGKTITTIRDIARGFRNLRQTFNGPAFTEGSGRHYREAGLVDGSYGQTYDSERKKPTPLFVDFQLLKTHTLGGDLGMGCCPYMFTATAHPSEQEYYDFVASEIAFGNIGLQEPYSYLSLDPETFGHSLLTYFMVQQLQQYYVMEPVERIGYFDGEHLIDTDQAIARDVQLQSQVNVRYQNGLEIWANCNPEGKTWTVQADGKTFILPKGGWLAQKGDELLEFSALVDGRRVDYVDGPDYTYVNPGEKEFQFAGQTYPAGQVTVRHKQGPLAEKTLHWSGQSPATAPQ